MTESSTAADTCRTYSAAIAVVAFYRDHRTIVMPSGLSWVSHTLPLTEVTMTLRHDEVFMVTNGKAETRYVNDLDEALATARRIGSEGSPDAIQILVPAIGKTGIMTYNLDSIYERAVAVTA